MSHFKRIACYNIVINITCNILSLAFYNIRSYGDLYLGFEVGFILLGLLLGHAAVLFIIAIIYFLRGQGQKGLNFLLTMGVVLSLGGCMCVGISLMTFS